MQKTRRERTRSGRPARPGPPHAAADGVPGGGPKRRQPSERVLRIGVSLALLVVTLAVYAPVWQHGFISLDDTAYVSENQHVAGGLTAANVWWAVTGVSAQAANWHPVTWLSHMLDVEVFGMNAGRHHAVSAVLHAANAVVLFLLLDSMTRRPWASAFVAALFAVHPLHVESVAWIAERKDVLSTLFWLLTTLAYVRHVREPRPARYAGVLALFALGLMSKPMLVTLPCTLLLLDWWPLNRLETSGGAPGGAVPASLLSRRWIPLLVEKWPLFLLAAASSLITVVAQRQGGAVTTLETIPFTARAGNAALSCLNYLRQMLWPTGLSLYYPHPGTSVSVAGSIGALAVVGLLCYVGLRTARSRPHVAVGIFWYLVTLLPVIGLVQVGLQARADRYTYVPLIGPFIAITWECVSLVGTNARRRAAAAVVAAAVVAALGVTARAQVDRWSDESALWTQALDQNPENFFAHYSLGRMQMKADLVDAALPHLERAIALAPWFAGAHDALGLALARLGRVEAAIGAHQTALRLQPDSTEVRANLGLAYERRGDVAAAIALYREALQRDPGRPTLHISLGHALGSTGDLDGAVAEMRETLRLQPDSAAAHAYLAQVLAQRGQPDDAMAEARLALAREPSRDDAHGLLGRLLLDRGQADEAIVHLGEAVRLQPESPASRSAFGAALATKGRLDDAIAQYTEAVRLAPTDADSRNQLGLCFAHAGRVAEAIAQFSEAIRLQPQLESAHLRLGMALAASGNLIEGAAHLREALRINPANAEARSGLQAISGLTGRRVPER
jgi:protein O-mannosyl-transferase